VREAIRLLENDGLVVHVPRVGAAVRSLDAAEINELYEMRGVLEGTAARLAARSASRVELDELATINAELDASRGDVLRIYDLNRQFHDGILASARNRYLSRSVEAIKKALLILGPSTMEEAARASAVVAEHAAVLAAIRAHDGDAAESAMRAHIAAAHAMRLRQFRTRNEENPR
jgi:DNA-binding GntR family transcriptional regulator